MESNTSVLLDAELNYSNYSEGAHLPSFRCGIPPFLPSSIPPAVDYIQGTIALLMTILTVVLNSFVIYLVACHRVMQQRAFFLALQISVVHLIWVVVMITITVSAFERRWLFGETVCMIMGVLHDGTISLRFLFTLIFALDRLFTVFMPFCYAKNGNKVSALMSVVVWILAFVRVIVSMKGGLDCYSYFPSFKTCTAVACSESCRIHILTFSTFLFVSSVVLPCALYCILFRKAKKLNNQTRPVLEVCARTNRPLRSLAQRKRERRALFTFFLLLLVVIGTTTPAYILYATHMALGKPSTLLILLQILVGRTCIYFLAVGDPIVILWNRDVVEVIHALKASVYRMVENSLNHSSVQGSLNHSSVQGSSVI